MHKLYRQYCALLSSPAQLDLCRQATDLPALLHQLKILWCCTALSDAQLLAAVAQLNQLPVAAPQAQLAGRWLPYRYQAQTQQVFWLLPDGCPTEPFLDEYVARCRQQLVNQIIQPRSQLAELPGQTASLPACQPAGFIFHLSRCGSTLLSGCLSELAGTVVFSEPPLLTGLLLDPQLSAAPAQTLLLASLRALIQLQAAAFPQCASGIIKWNAWDIFHWRQIRDLYPAVPVVFLVRDPVEILASHQRSAGRHMAGDPTLSPVHPVFTGRVTTLLQWRCQVLQALMAAMLQHLNDPQVWLLDYGELTAGYICQVAQLFALCTDTRGPPALQRRLQFHAKAPAVAFTSDIASKQDWFSPADKACIQHWLQSSYVALRQQRRWSFQ